MSATTDHAPALGEGVYTISQVAQILSRRERPLSVRQVRYWTKTELVPPTYEIDGHPLLTFHDLISLEVIARLIDAGWSVQAVRKFEEELRKEFSLSRPFAYKVFYAQGFTIWAKHHEGDQEAVELLSKGVSRRHKPLVWAGAVKAFAEEIRFDADNQAASAWHPTPWVEINPLIQFGAPVVTGTRVPIATVIANLEVGTPGEVADWYDLSLDEVNGAREYVALN